MELSRFITFPSVEEKSDNHTVVVIDADNNDIENIGLFCKVSNKNYDIYLYKQDLVDLDWLTSIITNADCVLIAKDSNVEIVNASQISKFGLDQQLNTPLAYFQQVDNI
jgi:hypothetical protein